MHTNKGSVHVFGKQMDVSQPYHCSDTIRPRELLKSTNNTSVKILPIHIFIMYATSNQNSSNNPSHINLSSASLYSSH